MTAPAPLHFLLSPDAHAAGKIFLGITIPLFITSITTLCGRIWSKLRSGVALGWEDYFIIAGFLCSTVDWALLTVSISWVADNSLKYGLWSIFIRGLKLGTIAIPIWGFSIGFIKISVACLLLRFQQNRSWKYLLYSLIGLIAAVTIGSCVFITTSCIPMAANWNPTKYPNAKCVGAGTVRTVSNFVGGFSIATDIVLSLFPLTFLVGLRRPFIEKVLIGFLMGVGLTASAASITKAVYVQKWAHNPSSLYLAYMISTFSTAEMLLGCTAACLPCLKTPIQKVLAKCGVSFEWEPPSQFWRSLALPSQAEEEISEDHAKRTESTGEKGSGSEKVSGSESEKVNGSEKESV